MVEDPYLLVRRWVAEEAERRDDLVAAEVVQSSEGDLLQVIIRTDT